VGELRSAEWDKGEPIHAPMGLRSAYPRGGSPKRGGVRRVECIVGAPVGIEDLPSRAEELG